MKIVVGESAAVVRASLHNDLHDRSRSTSVTVPDDVSSITVVVGYDADGGDAILQVDDVSLSAAH